jgi:hypothetical protein
VSSAAFSVMLRASNCGLSVAAAWKRRAAWSASGMLYGAFVFGLTGIGAGADCVARTAMFLSILPMPSTSTLSVVAPIAPATGASTRSQLLGRGAADGGVLGHEVVGRVHADASARAADGVADVRTAGRLSVRTREGVATAAQ